MKKEGREGKTAVVIGTVTNDLRIFKVPKLTVAALHVTEKAHERILKAGGEVMTLDQFALKAPTGQNSLASG